MHVAAVCLLIATIVVAASASVSTGAFSSIEMLIYPNGNCAGAVSGNYTYPLRQCTYGVEYACHTTDKMCVDLKQYKKTAEKCSGQEIGKMSTVCDYCYPHQDIGTNETTYGTISGCGTSDRQFRSGCDSTCTTCTHVVDAGDNSCVFNGGTDTYFLMLNERPCETLVSERYWPESKTCTGRPQHFMLPANSCCPNIKSDGSVRSFHYDCIRS